MTIFYTSITPSHVSLLLPIENASHSHPWTEKTFASCIGGRYFGEFASLTTSTSAKQDDIVGFYIGEYVAGEATLMDICVPPYLQGNGYGKALMEQFLAQSKAMGAAKVWLEVRSSNIAAQMLYINQGFIETGRRTGYYPKAIGYEDAIVMCKTY